MTCTDLGYMSVEEGAHLRDRILVLYREKCLPHGLNALLSRMLWSAGGSRDDCLMQSTIGQWDGQIGRSQQEKKLCTQ